MNDLIRILDKKIFINFIMMEIYVLDYFLVFFKYYYFCFNIYNFIVLFNFVDYYIVVFFYFVLLFFKIDNLVYIKKFVF